MPELRCACGTWAYKDRASVKDCGIDIAGPQSTVFGEVLGWGRIALHERGWRSQFAYPLSLQIYCTDCYVKQGAVVQADILGVSDTWRRPPFYYACGFCATDRDSELSAYQVEKYLRMRYLHATGFSSPFLELTDERLGQVLDRFGLTDWRTNGQEVETPREFQKVRIFSLIFGRDQTDPQRVCQACGKIGRIYTGPMSGGPWSRAWKLLPNFVGRFHEFVCAPCGQMALNVRPPEHKASNPREWVAELLEDQRYRFCGICQAKQDLSEITQVRGEWLCSGCSSKLEDILRIDEAVARGR